MRKHYLHCLFEPDSVAVVGASDRLDAVGGRVLRNILDGGFAGKVYPVNSRRASVQGLQAYSDIGAIGAALDLAVIAVPAADVAGVLQDAAVAGVAAAIVLSAGFGEQAVGGRSQQQLLIEIARAHRIALLGPHTLGVLRPSWNFNASFARSAVAPGRVALLSQSVGFCNAMLDWASSNGFGLSLLASPGAAADVDFGDLLDFCAVDASTRSILLYVERIADARAFVSGLRLAARVKPVVVLKSGGDDAEGWVADDAAMVDAAFDAAVRRAGAVRVTSVHELLTAARTLASGTKAAAGQRLAIITNAAGPGAMAKNRARRHGLPLASLAESSRAGLSRLMPPGWHCQNPVDLLGDASPERYAGAARVLLEDPHVDSLLALVTPQGVTDPLACADALISQAKSAGKPVVACWMGQDLMTQSRALLSAASIPHFSSPERAVDALAYLASYRNSQDLLLQLTPPLSRHATPDIARARALLREHSTAALATLPAAAVVTLFSAMDAPMALVTGAGNAAMTGDRRIAVLLAREPVFGPVVCLGPGGCALRRLPGVQASLPPLNEFLCRELIGRVTQRFAMESLPPQQESQLVALLMTLSAIACELPEVDAISIPSLPLCEGPQTLAVEAVTVQLAAHAEGDSVPGYGHMAIHPYPSSLENTVVLPGGDSLLVRPMRPEDSGMEQRFVDGLSPESRYYRFMYRLDHLSTAMLARFTQIDYDREMALVAVADGDTPAERIVGVSRYAVNPDAVSCEFALAVADETQGKGVGSLLMEMLFRVARDRGLEVMEGEVLAHNRKMLALCRGLGFTLRRRSDDPDIVAVTRPL